ncbi:fibroblast growth factor receptor-like isoform X3 [Acropora muricata]|uniref:fibroblast growth factor receptor-like isoform X3 n=1 Tax=Acropora muricata TaxID=159855 RepID=UPI0034E61447
MSGLNNSHLIISCIIVWSMAIFRLSDGGSITWFEPPPFETVTDSSSIATANINLTKGSPNEKLSCNFSLSADLSLVVASIKLGGSSVASFVQTQQRLWVQTGLDNRFNVTWVPNKLTLILLNVTSAEEGDYRCEVLSVGGSVQTWARTIRVSLLVPASITEITGKTVIEGNNLTLKCLVEGEPKPRITWTRLSDNSIVIMPLNNFSRHDVRDYKCTADNGVGTPATRNITIDVLYPPEVNGNGQNASVAAGVENTFSCPVDGNPVPNITWYSETGAYRGKQFKTRESGCYICVARNVLGISDNITQCLIIDSSLPTVPPTTDRGQMMLSSITASRTDPSQIMVSSTTTSQSPSSSSITAPKDPSQIMVSSTTTSQSPSSSSITAPKEIKCSCSDNNTTLLVIIGVLGMVIILLIAVIIWQQRKLRAIRNRRPDEVAEERDAGFYDSGIVMKDMKPAHLRPKNPTQQEIPDERPYMPLHCTSPNGEGSISPVSLARNVEYAPLEVRTRSWEVERNDVKIERIIGKGAFGQVAKGTAKNLAFRSGGTSVAIKMVKANAPESDKRDLKSELELLKTLKPHPHVIKLLGCVTESEPLLVLIEYVPYGDLLGYLRKSRGLNDTYYKDPDIKPTTSLTSQQLMKFAWQIADGMSYLCLRKVVHRDLAARNVLVGERETCKITDFGMARDVHEENIYERKTKGRLPVKWTAYESLLYGQYTTKSDVWSYGVVLYEISTIGGSPYPRMEGRKIANLLQQGYRMPKPEHVENDLYQIMMNCWQSEPEARPSFNDLTQQLKHMLNQRKTLINMHIYDNALYANLEDLNA